MSIKGPLELLGPRADFILSNAENAVIFMDGNDVCGTLAASSVTNRVDFTGPCLRVDGDLEVTGNTVINAPAVTDLDDVLDSATRKALTTTVQTIDGAKTFTSALACGDVNSTGIVTATEIDSVTQTRLANKDATATICGSGAAQTLEASVAGVEPTIEIKANPLNPGVNSVTLRTTPVESAVSNQGTFSVDALEFNSSTVRATAALITNGSLTVLGSILGSITVTGSANLQGGVLTVGSTTIDDGDLALIQSVTPGTAQAFKTLAADGSVNLSGLNALNCSDIVTTTSNASVSTIGTLNLGGTQVTASGNDINTLTGINPGVVQPATVVAVDTSSNVTGFSTVTSDNFNATNEFGIVGGPYTHLETRLPGTRYIDTNHTVLNQTQTPSAIIMESARFGNCGACIRGNTPDDRFFIGISSANDGVVDTTAFQVYNNGDVQLGGRVVIGSVDGLSGVQEDYTNRALFYDDNIRTLNIESGAKLNLNTGSNLIIEGQQMNASAAELNLLVGATQLFTDTTTLEDISDGATRVALTTGTQTISGTKTFPDITFFNGTIQANGLMSLGAGIRHGGVTIASGATYTVLSTDMFIVADTSATIGCTITLPDPSAGGSSRMIWIKRVGNDNVTVQSAGGKNVEGGSSYTQIADGQANLFVANNSSDWYIFGKF